MSLSEKIQGAQKALVAHKDDLVESTKALEAAPDEEALLEQVEELTGIVNSKTKTLNALMAAEDALKERAKAVEGAPAFIHSPKKETGEIWLKSAVCALVAHGERKSIDQVMEERYPKDASLKAVHDLSMVQKSAVPLATTFDAGWAAELVRSDVQGFIDVLTPTSVAAAIAGMTHQLNFDGYDSITIPRRAPRSATNDLGGAFVGEGGAIPLGQMNLGSTKLSRYKMAVISDFSRELASRSTPAIEGLIRQGILDDMSIRLDSVFLGVLDIVTGVQPAGITHGVTATAGDGTGGVTSVTADIKTMLGSLAAAGLGVRPVLLMNTQDALSVGLMQSTLGEFVFRDEISGNNLLTVSVIKSLNVQKGTVICVDASTLATAFDQPEFDVSDVATIVQANSDATAPTMANDGKATDALGTANQVPQNGGISVEEDGKTLVASAGYEARSLWQTYSVGIRSVLPTTWGIVQPGGIAVVNTLSW